MKKGLLMLVILVIAFNMLLGSGVRAGDLVEVEYVGLNIYDPVYLAEDLGYFEDEGIELNLYRVIDGGPSIIQAVSSGRAQAGLSANMSIINAVSNGMPIIATNDLQSVIDGSPLKGFYVREGSEIYSVEDLKGKTIAINTFNASFHYALKIQLEKHDLTEDDVELITLPFASQITALVNGDIDMASLIPPHTTAISATYGEVTRQLFDGLDVFERNIQFSTIFVNKVWAEENPEIAEGFVTAIGRASQWLNENEDNQDKAREIVSDHTGIKSEFIGDYYFQPNGMVIEKDFDFWIDFMKDQGDIDNDWITTDDLMTNEYNRLVD